MKYLEDLKEALEKELERYAKSGEITINSLDKVHKLTDTIKNIDKIEHLESGYSEATDWMGDGHIYGTSYARGRTGNVKRDSMGRYSKYEDRRYSRDGAKDELMEKIDEMMEDADPNEREALKECRKAIERV